MKDNQLEFNKIDEDGLSIYKQIVEQSPNCIVITNVKGNIEYVNLLFIELTGYKREELIGKNPRILNARTQPKDYYAQMWQTITKGETWQGEFNNKKKNGDLYWEKVKITPIKNKNGEIEHYLGIKEDITEKKKIEQALQEKELYLQQIIDLVPYPIFAKNKNFEFVFANKALADLYGTDIVSIIGKTDFDFVKNKEEAEMFIKEDREVLQTGKRLFIPENKVTYQDGNVRYYQTVKILFKNPVSAEKSILGTTVDITAQKQIEKQLLKQNEQLLLAKEKAQINENRFFELFNNMSNGCAIYKVVNDGEDFIFVDYNKAGEKLDGIKKENVINKKLTDVFPRVKEFGLFDVLQRVSKTGIPEHFPDAFYKDKNLKAWRDNYVFKLPDGNIVAVYEDKTKEKNAELALLKQNQKLFVAKNEAEKSKERNIQILDSFKSPVYLSSSNFEIIYYNKVMEKIIGKNKIGAKCYKTIYNLKEQCQWCKIDLLDKVNNNIDYDIAVPEHKKHININHRLLDNNMILNIYHDITDRVETEQKIFNAIVAAEEKEKTNFAIELHDGLGPLMSTLKMFLQAIDKVDDPQAIKDFANKSQIVFDDIMKTITEVSNNLSPHILHKFGLYTGIKVFIEKIATHSDIQFVFDFNKKKYEELISEKNIDKAESFKQTGNLLEITIYRIITELINNSIKHSKANEIKIKFDVNKQIILLEYSDNGIGFDVEEVFERNIGLGILNIRNRLKKINGTVKFISSENKGFFAEILIDYSGKIKK